MAVTTVLVTGGAGFIGSHVVDRFLELGNRVVILDDLSTGKVQQVSKHKQARFYHLSVTDPDVEDVFRREQPNMVIHHAAQASVAASVKDPVRDAAVNIDGTVRLLEASVKTRVQKFIFASTGGALYGDPKHLPCKEMDPADPLSPYALSKLSAEYYVHLFLKLHGLPYTVLRYANVYGPRQDPHGEAGVIAIFTRLMLEGKQPHIFGDGNQERDFVYVSDVVAANVAATTERGKGHAGDNQVYNIGTGKPTSVNGIFDSLRSILDFRWRPIYEPPRPGEVTKVYLDASKAARPVDEGGLDWTPKVDLQTGLLHTVRHLQKTMAAAT